MIKRNLLKLLTVIITLLFLFVTAADMYIKTYGDISQHSATEEIITDAKHLGISYKKTPDCIRLMTYNILADTIGYEGSDAAERADGVCNILEEISPDVAGLQETSRKWFACIYNNTNYRFVHPVRTAFFQTMTTLIYNPDTVTLITSGEDTFKNGGDSRLRRMVWAVFLHKETDKTFIVVNTHFNLNDTSKTPADNTVPLTQVLELITLCKNLKDIFFCPVFPIGDFNAKESTEKTPSPVYDILCASFENTKNLSESISYGEATTKKTLSNDHIFLYGDAEIKIYCTLSQKSFKVLSDHYPIFSDIKI